MENFFDEMAAALQHHDLKRLEMIGYRGPITPPLKI
jgi:hypothetical protein